jgi:hypothetical protein
MCFEQPSLLIVQDVAEDEFEHYASLVQPEELPVNGDWKIRYLIGDCFAGYFFTSPTGERKVIVLSPLDGRLVYLQLSLLKVLPEELLAELEKKDACRYKLSATLPEFHCDLAA